MGLKEEEEKEKKTKKKRPVPRQHRCSARCCKNKDMHDLAMNLTQEEVHQGAD